MLSPPKFWSTINVWSLLLWPLSQLYRVVSWIEYRSQEPIKVGSVQSEAEPDGINAVSAVTVICIGNVVVGGSGKTPLAIALGKQLMAQGRKPVYACRNYGAKLEGPVVIEQPDPRSVLSSRRDAAHVSKRSGYTDASAVQACLPDGPRLVDRRSPASLQPGDVIEEALLLARIAPTVVAQSRLAAVEAAAKLGDIVIVDDGFQNNSFQKDVSILAIGDDRSFGNGFVFPAGPLREKLGSALQRANLVFMMNEIGGSHTRSRSVLAEQGFDNRKVFSVRYEYELHQQRSTVGNKREAIAQFPARSAGIGVGFCHPRAGGGDKHGGHDKSSKQLKREAAKHSQKYFAFCGIANPYRFLDSLAELKLNVVDHAIYPDHHQYSDAEMKSLVHQASAAGAQLITTEKDFVKLEGGRLSKDVAWLGLKLELDGHAALAMTNLLKTPSLKL